MSNRQNQNQNLIKSENKQITSKDIANTLNNFFTNIGPNLASKIDSSSDALNLTDDPENINNTNQSSSQLLNTDRNEVYDICFNFEPITNDYTLSLINNLANCKQQDVTISLHKLLKLLRQLLRLLSHTSLTIHL